MIDPTQDFIAMVAISVLLLVSGLGVAVRAAAQVVPSFRDLPNPYVRLLPRNYDGGWRAAQGERFVPIVVSFQAASIRRLAGLLDGHRCNLAAVHAEPA